MTAGLSNMLPELRSKIHRYRELGINEQGTKTSLIQPVLRALGWNVEDIDEVYPEYKRRATDNPVDYALLVSRQPRLFVEAKALGEDLSDPRWATQFISYATAAGVKWIALTNGDEYRIYNAYAEVPVERKIFRTVRITEEYPGPEETLGLLSKERVQNNDLESLWRAHFVDQRVRDAIERLFSPEGDQSFVNAIRKHVPDLPPSEIRSSLQRVRVHLDFPEETPKVQTGLLLPESGQPQRTVGVPQNVSVSLKDLIRAGLIHPPLPLEQTYKKRHLSARVEKDGGVTFGERTYDTPTAAAEAAQATVIGTGKKPSVNGWKAWEFQDTDGQLRPISVLRDRYPGGDIDRRPDQSMAR